MFFKIASLIISTPILIALLFFLGVPANLAISMITLIALIIYAFFTYLIAKEIYEPYVSFTLHPIKFSHIRFNIVNRSKVEVEVFGKLWSRINNELFDFKADFYGNGHPWPLQPFTTGQGHFELTNISNKKGEKLIELVKSKKVSSVKFSLQIKYKKVGSKKWKKPSPQKFVYDFDKNMFSLNV